MSTADRRVPVAALAVITTALIVPVALVGLVVWAWASEPAHQLDLPGTRWAVVAVADEATGSAPPMLAFENDGNSASLALSCGIVRLGWAWDTDGAAQGFGIDAMPATCQANEASDQTVLDAILGVEEWSIQSDDRITLSGTTDLRLERAGSG